MRVSTFEKKLEDLTPENSQGTRINVIREDREKVNVEF